MSEIVKAFGISDGKLRKVKLVYSDGEPYYKDILTDELLVDVKSIAEIDMEERKWQLYLAAIRGLSGMEGCSAFEVVARAKTIADLAMDAYLEKGEWEVGV